MFMCSVFPCGSIPLTQGLKSKLRARIHYGAQLQKSPYRSLAIFRPLCQNFCPKAANIKPAIQYIHSPKLPVSHRVASKYINIVQHTISRTVQLILLHIMSPVFVLPDARLLLSGEVGEGLLNTTKEILEDLPRRPQRCRNNGEASARSG